MSQKNIDKIISDLASEFGFRFIKNSWFRDRAKFRHVIHCQKSAKTGRITFNFGIADQDVWRLFRDEPLPDYIDEATCVARTRIGFCFPAQTDTWWDSSDFDSEDGNLVVVAAIKFFATLNSRQELLIHLLDKKFLTPVDKAYTAILLYLGGDPRRALSVLKELETDAGDEWDLKIKRIVSVVVEALD